MAQRRPSAPHTQDAESRIAAFTKHAEMTAVARVLRDRRDDILRGWLNAARRQPFHASHPEGAVADHIPPLFDALVDLLERSAPRSVEPTPPLEDEALRQAAQEHARHRFERGLTAPDILTEFRLLRQEIGLALRRDSDEASTADVLGAELLVHDALDSAAGLALAALNAYEAEHQRAAAVLAALVSSSSDAILGKTLDGVITSWNPAAERMYGYSAAEVVGRNVSVIVPPERPEELRDILARVRRGEAVPAYDTIRVRKDGSRIDVSVTVSPVRNASGEIIGASAIARDIRERRQLETEMALLAESGAALGSSLDYKETLRNVAELAVPAMADWCSVHIVDQTGGTTQIAVVHRDPAKVRQAEELERRYPTSARPSQGVLQVVASGQAELVADISDELLRRSVNPEELELVRGLGLCSYIVVPLRARGRVVGALSFVSSESGRRYGQADLRLAQELADRAALALDNAQLYNDAQEALRVRDELLAVVAHDLRTPLTSIKGNAELMRRHVERGLVSPETIMDRARAISEGVARMTAQIDELLDAARLRAGEALELTRRPTDLVALAYRVAEQVQETTRLHRIDVQTLVPELTGEWDALRIERVLGNLLGNAVKYSPGGGEVTVRVATDERDGRPGACLSVHDKGVGIPAGDIPHVFERYHRASNVVGRFPGEGIGLAGVKQIIDQHGGSIHVNSRESQGSTFVVWLPIGE